jgi:hypothetical protein
MLGVPVGFVLFVAFLICVSDGSSKVVVGKQDDGRYNHQGPGVW